MPRRLLIVVCACLMGMGLSKCWQGERYEDQAVTDSSDSTQPAPPKASTGTDAATVEYSTALNAYANLLTQFVNEDGLVDYEALYADQEMRKGLAAYLDWASKTKSRPVGWEDKDEVVFLINVCNAAVLQAILGEIQKQNGTIPARFASGKNNPILASTLQVGLLGTTALTLREIATRIAGHKALKQDPRKYFALSAGRKGDPPLRNKAYDASQLDEQLADQEKKTLGNLARVPVPSKNKDGKTQCFVPWTVLVHRADFGGDAKTLDLTQKLRDYLTPLVPPTVGKKLKDATVVTNTRFDYSLNKQSP
jgi:hypothetical protein